MILEERFYQQPPYYQNTLRQAVRLQEQYPWLRVFSYGRSVLGRDILAYGVGQRQAAVCYIGGVHGSEWLTVLLLYRFLGELAAALEEGGSVAQVDARQAMEHSGLLVVPALNPDGIEISLRGPAGALWKAGEIAPLIYTPRPQYWQSNANGVDLNHNFPAGWEEIHQLEVEAGITGPSHTRYGGPYPFSEPETRAVRRRFAACLPRYVIAFHSQGEVIYYQYGEHTPPQSELMAQVLAASSGYALSQPEGLAGGAGLKDWFIERHRRPGFTVEIGRGQNPLPVSDFEPIYQQLQEMLMLGLLL